MNKSRNIYSTLCTIIIFPFLLFQIFPQPARVKNAAEIKLALDKLNVLGSVLYIAAHPDDENTAFLAYCSSGRLLRTGYLSLTRGDGGQNLIGSEQSEELSVIRTQELLAARKIDGAEQFFSRAIDFGYSKNPGETLNIWGEQKILSDVVWVIRKFRPDVIVLRFPDTGEGGHGNHTASAILAEEAFKISNDPTVFPEQLKFVKPWQAKRILWNAWLPIIKRRNEDVSKLLHVDLGSYNPLLGKSYTEIAAESRSMHKSQGFGSSGRRGEDINYFEFLGGDPAKSDFFDGINDSWSRIDGGEKVSKLLKKANEEFNPEKPFEIIPVLLQAYSEMEKIKDDYWVPLKEKELLDVIRSAAGIWIEATSADYSSIPSGSISILAGIVNRSDFPFTLKSVQFKFGENKILNLPLKNENFETIKSIVTLPKNMGYTQPYWLQHPHGKGNYEVKDQNLIGKPENDPPLDVAFTLEAGNDEFTLTTPVLYRWTDPVLGEKYRPFEVRTPVSINLDNKVYLFPDKKTKIISVVVKSNAENISGRLIPNIPSDWNIEPKETSFNLKNKNDEAEFKFRITPPINSSEEELIFSAETNHGNSDRSIETINYTHIPIQTLFPKAAAKLLRLDIKKTISNIGYIMGAGDFIPQDLEELGYKVHLLSDNDLDNADLSKYDAIVAGVRAYNTRKRLEADQKRLMDYIKNGGTYVVQYNNSFDLVTDKIGPYPFRLSHDRVTVEEAPVKFLNADNILLNFPNKIIEKDFDGWIQERGLYFSNSWNHEYETVISSHDPGETPKDGGLLFAKYGKGIFIYTGYAWFRQLPAGVPGAYRIFVNLISAGKQNTAGKSK